MPAKLDFMIIGAMKSGTTSLAFYLNQSSQIYIPKEKELPFFLGIPFDPDLAGTTTRISSV